MTNAKILADEPLDLMFREARTHRDWLQKDVSDALLQAVYELAKLGPTASNRQPMRVVFVKSPEAKERLKKHLDAGNIDRMMNAPVCAVVAFDAGGKGNEAEWLRNSSLGGAYLLMAARALGLDCGPMSGFSNAGVDAEFFAGTAWKSNFLINIGYGDASKLQPRKPRLSFDEACKII